MFLDISFIIKKRSKIAPKSNMPLNIFIGIISFENSVVIPAINKGYPGG